MKKSRFEEFTSLCGWLKASTGAWMPFTEVDRKIILKFFGKKAEARSSFRLVQKAWNRI
jgi:hypothetical protein